jgi:hypothetical protein
MHAGAARLVPLAVEPAGLSVEPEGTAQQAASEQVVFADDSGEAWWLLKSGG